MPFLLPSRLLSAVPSQVCQGCDAIPGGEGVGVLRPGYALPVGQQILEQAQRACRITAVAGPSRDVIQGGGEGAGVVRADNPFLSLRALLESTIQA